MRPLCGYTPRMQEQVYPARRGTRAFTAEDLWRIPRVGAPVPSPDGRVAAVTVTTFDLQKNEGRTRIWLVPAAGGEPRALTSPEHSSNEPAFSPDGRRLAFVRKDADGRQQLHVMSLDGGEPERVTDMPLGVFDPTWLPDGRRIVVAGNLIRGHLTPEATKAELERREKDPVKAHVTEERFYRYWDTWLTTGEVPHLFVLDLETRELRDLMPESTLWFDPMDPSGQYDVSPDGGWVAYAATAFETDRSLVRSCVCVVPVDGSEGPRCLTTGHPADDERPRWSPDGAAVVYGMKQDPFFYADRMRLVRWDLATGEHAPFLDAWELSPVAWEFAPDGALLVEAERDARHGLWRYEGTGAPREIVRGGTVSGARPAADGAVWFAMNTLSEPTEAYRLAAGAAGAERLTHFTDAALDGVAFGEVREIRFPGAAGETVQMFIVMPPSVPPPVAPTAVTPPPLVHVIHGGPHGISGDNFHPRWNAHLFAAPGYVAAMVNFQGSTSWGQDFAQRIQGAWGERPYQDVMAATDLLVGEGIVDAERMAATGGSYGGYLVAWIAGQTDRFRCIVNHAGVFDVWSMYATDITQGRHQAFGGEPWDRMEALDRWNPVRFAKGIRTPMLVVHGERDYRVPVTQGLFCYNVLKAKGVPARLVYFPDENHWVLKPRNSLLWYREVQEWLARWLGGSAGSAER